MFFMYLNETRKYDINVTALVRNEKKAWEKFEDFRDMPYFHLKVQDVCTPITMEEKPEYIIHAAGNASPHFILHDPVGIIAANTTGTVNVLELARKSGTKKVLYTSTREVYGKMPDGTEEIHEETFGSLDRWNSGPVIQKVSGWKQSVRVTTTNIRVPFTAVRIAHSYGPGMTINNDGRVMRISSQTS
ncbi:MAG: NAD-dependent epimerase/dehydratase family protein [Sellimonas intestinalis]